MKFFASLIVLILLAACSGMNRIADIKKRPNPVIAHRGAFKKNGFPENSIAALKEAIRLGCAGSEFDVRMTSDDTLVVNHDPHYQKFKIEKTKYKQLLSHPLSNGEPIPTLRQYLLAGVDNNSNTRLILEIKPSGINNERAMKITEDIVFMVKELGVEAMVDYISFDYDVLLKLRELVSDAILQYLDGDRSPEKLKEDGINGADYHISVFRRKPQWIRSAKENGVLLNAWTVNKEKDMLWLLEHEFDFITTNEPEKLMQLFIEN